MVGNRYIVGSEKVNFYKMRSNRILNTNYIGRKQLLDTSNVSLFVNL